MYAYVCVRVCMYVRACVCVCACVCVHVIEGRALEIEGHY